MCVWFYVGGVHCIMCVVCYVCVIVCDVCCVCVCMCEMCAVQGNSGNDYSSNWSYLDICIQSLTEPLNLGMWELKN